MYCTGCGAKLDDNTKYCPSCGKKVGMYEGSEGAEERKNIETEVEGEKEKIGEDTPPFVYEAGKAGEGADSAGNTETPAEYFMTWWNKQKKEMKGIIIGAAVLAIVILIIVIKGNNNIVGSWRNGEGMVVFDKNGNYTMDGDLGSGTYKVSGSQLIMISEGGSEYIYTFSVDDDILTITYENGKNEVMYREK